MAMASVVKAWWNAPVLVKKGHILLVAVVAAFILAAVIFEPWQATP